MTFVTLHVIGELEVYTLGEFVEKVREAISESKTVLVVWKASSHLQYEWEPGNGLCWSGELDGEFDFGPVSEKEELWIACNALP